MLAKATQVLEKVLNLCHKERAETTFAPSLSPDHNREGTATMANRSIRPIRIEGNVAYVPLTHGREALIDVADVHLVEAWNWHVFSRHYYPYAARTTTERGVTKTILMHRFLLNAPDGVQVDHISGDRFDNRRFNLRLATPSQNAINRAIRADNTSGFKGVAFHKPSGKWCAVISMNGVRTHLGSFDTASAASDAYEAASEIMHAEWKRRDKVPELA